MFFLCAVYGKYISTKINSSMSKKSIQVNSIQNINIYDKKFNKSNQITESLQEAFIQCRGVKGQLAFLP